MPRIKLTNNVFEPKRKSRTVEVVSKAFFALDGTETEVRYVKVLAKHYTNSSLYRFYRNNDGEKQNIALAMEELSKYLKENKPFELAYSELPDIIFNFMQENNIIFPKRKINSIIDKYRNSKCKKESDAIDSIDIRKVVEKIEKAIPNDVIDEQTKDEIIDYLSEQTNFYPNVDKIIFIGDRDRGNYTNVQFEQSLELAKDNNFYFIITNPCIEFWFLLHFTDALKIDKSKWNDDNAADLVYQELKAFDPRYGKTTYDAESYLSKTKIAIENAKNYESNIKILKDKIGTNMPELFKILEN